MLGDVLTYLECPHCQADLSMDGAVRCAAGHEFDVARQGYVNLLSGKASVTGDNAEMVVARAAFLDGGHYAPIMRSMVAAAQVEPAGCVADLGAGTGHYLAAVLDAGPERVGLALEIAKPALRRAARAHPRLGAVGCDAWGRLPVRDGVISLVLNVFAPRNPAEIHRILEPEGRLVVVAPTERHLSGLVTELGLLTVAPDKAKRVTAALAPRFELSTQDTCEFEMSLSHEEVLTLVGMGPSAWHVASDALRVAVTALPAPVTVTSSVLVSSYRRV